MTKQNKIILAAVIILVVITGLIYLNRGVKIPTNNGGQLEVKVEPISASDHIFGAPSAPVQMIVYSDFECPFCAQFVETMKKVEENFKDKVVVAFRHYPLGSHPWAEKAAEASECAAEQGKFWEMHDKLFADNVNGRMSIEQFKKDAVDLGLSQEQFNQCLDSGKYSARVAEERTGGDKAGVTGTPTSFINGIIYPGAYPFEDFVENGQPQAGMKTIISKLLK